MSLDVYLTEITPIKKKGTGVFIRKNGQTVELTIEEVKEKFNGNISAVTWKSNADPVATEKKYGYVYDKLNILPSFYPPSILIFR